MSLRLLLRGRDRDHEAAGHARDLDAVDAQPAARPRDQHLVAGLDMRDVADRIQLGPDRAGDDRGLVERHLVGHDRDIVVLDADELRVAAIDAHVAEELTLVARGLAPGAAIAATAADVAPLHRGHPVARLEVAHLGSDLFDDAGHLVARDERHLHAALEHAVARDHVVEAHAARFHLDQHVVAAHLRHRHVGEHERVEFLRAC